jgi:NAD dependent epimerase/dehydratase family enzyme
VNIFLFLFDQKNVAGPVNCTAPQAVCNSELTKAIGEALGVPTFLPFVPAFLMKLSLGEFGDLRLKGQKVVPQKLTALGYQFRFPTMK